MTSLLLVPAAVNTEHKNWRRKYPRPRASCSPTRPELSVGGRRRSCYSAVHCTTTHCNTCRITEADARATLVWSCNACKSEFLLLSPFERRHEANARNTARQRAYTNGMHLPVLHSSASVSCGLILFSSTTVCDRVEHRIFGQPLALCRTDALPLMPLNV